MELNRILWPTDFSANAAHALPYVHTLAAKFGTEIHVLYVLPQYGAWGSSYGEYDAADLEKMQRWEHEMAERHLEEVCSTHLDGCPLFIRHIAVGDPAKEILALAEREKIDMIVMATKGRQGNHAFGSVAERVTRCACVPVVTIPVPAAA
jgi:nucleotide-binding universal stress UspA family protein